MYGFSVEIEETVVITRTSRVGYSYLQSLSLLTQLGLHDNHRSGFLNNNIITTTTTIIIIAIIIISKKKSQVHLTPHSP